VKEMKGGDHVFIVGGTYKGSFGTFLHSTEKRYYVLVDGKLKPSHLSKQYVTLHEPKEVVSNTTTPPPAANGDIMMNLSSVIKKCEDLEREIAELKEMI
jgi:hypothetical protein